MAALLRIATWGIGSPKIENGLGGRLTQLVKLRIHAGLARTSMKVYEGLQGNLSGDIAFALSLLKLVQCIIVGCHVCLVVLVVVQFHDLAGNGRLKRAVVICRRWVRLCLQRPVSSGARLTFEIGKSGLAARGRRCRKPSLERNGGRPGSRSHD